MSEAPWWARAGPETCEACERPWQLEAGWFCVCCDAFTCATCIVFARHPEEVLCPACAAAAEEGDS